jgi:hypothetical protein
VPYAQLMAPRSRRPAFLNVFQTAKTPFYASHIRFASARQSSGKAAFLHSTQTPIWNLRRAALSQLFAGSIDRGLLGIPRPRCSSRRIPSLNMLIESCCAEVCKADPFLSLFPLHESPTWRFFLLVRTHVGTLTLISDPDRS